MKRLIMFILLILTVTTVKAAEKYAVLVTGDYHSTGSTDEWNGGEGAVNGEFREFWNDTYLMWEMLLEKGYKNENIHVLFADGEDYWKDRPWIDERYTPESHYLQQITDYSATNTNLETVTTELQNKLTDDDLLFVWTFDHGGTSNGHSILKLLDGDITDSDFAALFVPITAHKKIYWMSHNNSGGFTSYLQANNALVSTSSQPNQGAFAADDKAVEGGAIIPELENEIINGVLYRHGEYNFHMYSASVGKSPAYSENYNGEAYSLADIDDDKIVSISETNSWESDHESIIGETPTGSGGLYSSLDYSFIVNTEYILPGFYTNLKGLVGISGDVQITDLADVFIAGNANVTLLENINLSTFGESRLYVGGNSVIEGKGNNLITVATGGILMPTGTSTFKNLNILGQGVLFLIGDLTFEDVITELEGGLIAIMEDVTLNIAYGSELNVNDNGAFELYNNTKLYVKNGGKFNILGSSESNVNIGYGGLNWQGIYAESGSEIELVYTNVTGAEYGIKGSSSSVKIYNSKFENCEHGISLVYTTKCKISNSEFIGQNVDSGNYGIKLVHTDATIHGNEIYNYSFGITAFSSSPHIIENNIHNNFRQGLYVNGTNSFPDLVLSGAIDGSIPITPNNSIYDNGENDIYGAQIRLDNQTGIYLQSGWNNIYMTPLNQVPVKPCIRNNSSLRLYIDATENYWGSNNVTNDFFTPEIVTSWLNYSNYNTVPYTDVADLKMLSGAERELKDAMTLEEEESYIEAAEKYTSVIESYPNTKEAYLSMSKLPSVSKSANANLGNIVALYNSKLNDQTWEEKKFIKEMIIKTEMINENYSTAINLAEEAKIEAETSGEILCSEIEIAISEAMQNGGLIAGDNNTNSSVTAEKMTKKFEIMMNKVDDYTDELLLGNNEENNENLASIPNNISLLQNYPNPFNPVTTIKFTLSNDISNLKLQVYNIKGELVQTLINCNMKAGWHSANFDGSNLSSGIYNYILSADSFTSMKRMLLVK